MNHRTEIKLLVAAVFAAGSLNASAPPPGVQKSFSSPQDAVQAVLQACEKNNTKALLALFGPDGKDIVESGDRKDDKAGRREFAALAKEKTNLIPDPMNPDRMILSIGAQDWPFPIPLVRQNGQWHFDSAEGREEILARRIGAHELSAIDICHGYVEAQFEYAQDHRSSGVPEYAQKIVSSPDKQDGLFWKARKGAPAPNVPAKFAQAAANMAPNKRAPYHGYYFRILTAQGPYAQGGAANYIVNGHMIGGFALVAWPAEYGVSGVQTFIVNHTGTVYEKHLGPDTAKLAEAMTAFDPDSTWRPVQPEEP